jgi:hypothetical protein
MISIQIIVIVAGSVGVAVDAREAGATTDHVALALEDGTNLVVLALALKDRGGGAAANLVVLPLKDRGAGAVAYLVVLALLLRIGRAGAATNHVILTLLLRTGRAGAATDLVVLVLLLNFLLKWHQ